MMLWLVVACGGSPSVEDAPPAEEILVGPAHPPAGQPQGQNVGKAGKHPGPPPMGPQRQGLSVDPTFEWSGVASASPRSIVIISLDTVRADRLGVYGGRAETPNLSAFADSGARFDSAISHFPETALSHWAMLTGVLPEVHGNVPANGGSRYQGPTAAEISREHGYATAAFIGGVTLTDQASGLSRGFDRYDDQFPLDAADMKRPGREVSDRASAWIRGQQGPYFAFVHYFDAHFPYTPAAPWDTRYDPDYTGTLTGSDADLRQYRDGGAVPSPEDLAHVLALYDGELSELDALLEPVLTAAGDDTVVVITADHGESFEHGYYFNHRAGLWDGVIHVPLLIRGPGVSPGTVISDQVGLIDVLPTVLSLAGQRQDVRMQGADLHSLLEEGDGAGRDVVYAITDPWMPEPQFAARTNEDKLIRQSNSVMVFDLTTDPMEDRPRSEVPSSLSTAEEEYRDAISSLSGHQAEVPSARAISEEECARLEALGYTHCGDSPTP